MDTFGSEPQEPAATTVESSPPSSGREVSSGAVGDMSCHGLANQRAEDEASFGFDQVSLQQIIEKTYVDCVAAKQRYGH